MFLQIVRYNIHNRINRILYLFFLSIFIGSILIARIDYGYYKKMYDSIFFTCCLLIPLTIWAIQSCFTRYKTIGVCLTDHHSFTLKYKAGMIKKIELTELLFIYDGYKGKYNDMISGLSTGIPVKEGVNNYLIFNNDDSNKVQILLRSKNEYKDLLNLLTELETSGIKTQTVHYKVFGFKNILKNKTDK